MTEQIDFIHDLEAVTVDSPDLTVGGVTDVDAAALVGNNNAAQLRVLLR